MDITTQAAPVARMPWRQLGILALIGLLVAVAAVAYVGARRGPSPAPPFGLAANGAIAMERDGDIVTVDHATGTVTPITTGPEIDRAPVYFRDGTRIAFERSVDVTRRTAFDHGRQRRRHRPGPGDPGAARRPSSVDPLTGRPRPARDDECRRRVETHRARRRRVPRAHADRHLAACQPGRRSSPRSTVLPTAARSSSWPSLPALPRAASTSSTRRRARRCGRSSSPRVNSDVFGASWSPTGDAISYGRVRARRRRAARASDPRRCRRKAAAIGRWTLGLVLRTTRQRATGPTTGPGWS